MDSVKYANEPYNQTSSALTEAVTLLHSTDSTCVIIQNTTVYQSSLRGIAPILSKLEKDRAFLEGASVADKVIGKSAAMLLIYGKIKELHANVISEYAAALLEQYHIPFTYDKKVPYIINRDGTGMCPMEKSVLKLSAPEEAFAVLKQTLAEIKQKNRT